MAVKRVDLRSTATSNGLADFTRLSRLKGRLDRDVAVVRQALEQYPQIRVGSELSGERDSFILIQVDRDKVQDPHAYLKQIRAHMQRVKLSAQVSTPCKFYIVERSSHRNGSTKIKPGYTVPEAEPKKPQTFEEVTPDYIRKACLGNFSTSEINNPVFKMRKCFEHPELIKIDISKETKRVTLFFPSSVVGDEARAQALSFVRRLLRDFLLPGKITVKFTPVTDKTKGLLDKITNAPVHVSPLLEDFGLGDIKPTTDDDRLRYFASISGNG